jgi:hypothetical protein
MVIVMTVMLVSLCGIAVVLILINLTDYVKKIDNANNTRGYKAKAFPESSTKIPATKVQDKSQPKSFKKTKRIPKLKKNEARFQKRRNN